MGQQSFDMTRRVQCQCITPSGTCVVTMSTYVGGNGRCMCSLQGQRVMGDVPNDCPASPFFGQRLPEIGAPRQGAVVAPPPSISGPPGTLVLPIVNQTGVNLQISFKSDNRPAEWPGGGQSYLLEAGSMNRYGLNCIVGEKICYGATSISDRRIWGTGVHHETSCTNCCHFCGPSEEAGPIILGN